MAAAQWAYVEKGEHVIVLVDAVTRDVTVKNAAEDGHGYRLRESQRIVEA